VVAVVVNGGGGSLSDEPIDLSPRSERERMKGKSKKTTLVIVCHDDGDEDR
jgi:hypothetical protein